MKNKIPTIVFIFRLLNILLVLHFRHYQSQFFNHHHENHNYRNYQNNIHIFHIFQPSKIAKFVEPNFPMFESREVVHSADDYGASNEDLDFQDITAATFSSR